MGEGERKYENKRKSEDIQKKQTERKIEGKRKRECPLKMRRMKYNL